MQESPKLSVIVPTYNERDNVVPLIESLELALAGIVWEVIFVDDDSPDGTAERVREAALANPRVRCLQRLGRRGLSSACIEGMLSSSARYFAVIDGDRQHDERLLPAMFHALESGEVDIAIGSRYMPGGGLGDWDQNRVRISRTATWLANCVIPPGVTDPMSGFFMLRREAFYGSVRKLSGIGFKILVDIFASSAEPLRFREFPYQFRLREAGESKLDAQVAFDFIMLILGKKIDRLIPVRFVAFAMVGASGVLVHLAVFTAAFHQFQLPFPLSQAGATLVAMTSNFTLNNLLTYRDRRLRSWAWLRGLFLFTLACSIGAMANVGVASFLFNSSQSTWIPAILTGWLPSVLAGIAVGTVWNYATTKLYVWRVDKDK